MGVISADKEAAKFGCKFSYEKKKQSEYMRVTLTGPKDYRAVKIARCDKSLDSVKEGLLIQFLMKFELGHLYGTEKRDCTSNLFKIKLSKLEKASDNLA